MTRDHGYYATFVVLAVISIIVGFLILDRLNIDAAARPAPVVQVVRLPNGEPVTCIVLEHSVTCDWSQFASSKVAKP